MKNFSNIAAVAALSTTVFAGAAFAGTLDDPIVEAPVPVPVPYVDSSDWTGFYGGLNLGYADIDGDDDVDGDGTTYGAHIGYDYDFGRYVVGAELEYDKFDIDLADGAAVADDVSRLKLRAGYDLGQTLVYLTAGSAFLGTDIGDDTGQFVGIGAAYKVTDSFTIGGELLGHRFDDIGGSGIDADATTFNIRGSFRF